MKSRTHVHMVACVCLWAIGSPAYAQTNTGNAAGHSEEHNVKARASGTFEVKLVPQAPEDKADVSLGRMTLDKQFHGDLEGTSKGQMLTASTDVKGSGAYVAIERVSGTLKDRQGSFVLQHGGVMERGALRLTITVVPDSGTGQLTGLAGTMTINIVNGKHFYEFEYTISQTAESQP